jgi:glycerol-3-phosphate O-acyltransferase / dihydroxyacetone phosphate acyltransferase
VTRAILTALLRLLLRVFFRRLTITGREHVPPTGPVLFVLNHPNALVDPVVLLCHAGRPVSFLAKEPLFRMPVLGFFVRALDSIPVWRHMDQADTSKNRATFLAARTLLARGGSLALFPEGTSHSDSRLKPFRTGAARIALGAAGTEGLRIVPAGLFYPAKTRFRSAALLCFGPPVEVRPVSADADGEPPAPEVRALTAQLEEALGGLTVQADHHEALRLVEAAERILSPGRPDQDELAGRLELRQRLVTGYTRLREADPARLGAIESRVSRYDHALRMADLTPDLLPASGYRAVVVIRVTLRALAVLLLLLPAAIAGMVVHAPAWFIIDQVARRRERTNPDVVATVKALGGLLFYPATWFVLGVAVGVRWTWPLGSAALLVAPWLGWAALRFLERADRLAGGARGLLLALTGRRRYLRLVAERSGIREELLAIGRDYGLMREAMAG